MTEKLFDQQSGLGASGIYSFGTFHLRNVMKFNDWKGVTSYQKGNERITGFIRQFTSRNVVEFKDWKGLTSCQRLNESIIGLIRQFTWNCEEIQGPQK